MNKTTWKTLAIIFIILFTLETLFIIWVWDYGTDILKEESECVLNICANGEYDAYIYDSIENICYCYKDGEIAYQEFIR